MSSFLTNLVTPSWYKSQVNDISIGATNYYRPLVRSGSIKPLWHIMIGTATVMYVATFIGKEHKHVQHARLEKKLALEEYRAKHGSSGHH